MHTDVNMHLHPTLSPAQASNSGVDTRSEDFLDEPGQDLWKYC